MPFHEAEQHSKEPGKRFGGAAATFRSVRSLRAAQGNPHIADQQRSGECLAAFSFAASLLIHFLWASKENE
jgi:hypothetical protein